MDVVYSFNPFDELSESEQKQILGVQANLWSEYIFCDNMAFYQILPRISALSEVQWRNFNDRNFSEFLGRIKGIENIYDLYGFIYENNKFREWLLILLNDFLRRYAIDFGLDFVISPYAKPKDKLSEFQKKNVIRDQQSIFLTKQLGGGFNSHLFDQQMASVSSSVAGYRENDFNYRISEQGLEDDNPPGEPIDYREFDEEDRKRVAQTMSEAIPGLDQTYLNRITKGNGYKK